MQVAQSYFSVLFRHRYSTYEMRVFLSIVKRANDYIKQQGRYSDFVSRAYNVDGVNLVIAIPLSSLAYKTHNWSPLKEAVRGLQGVKVEYYDKVARVWYSAPIIGAAELREREGILRVTVAEWLMHYITDFTNGGFRLYQFEKAMSLKNPFAARMYLITCSMTRPSVMYLDALKRTLGVDGLYPRLHDFLRRVVDPARDELERQGCNGFTYEILRKYKEKPHSEPVSIRLVPVKREVKSLPMDKQIEDFYASVPHSMEQYLSSAFRFSFKELRSNKATLASFAALGGWQDKLVDICDRARRLSKNHGYIIAAMKSEVSEASRGREGVKPSSCLPPGQP